MKKIILFTIYSVLLCFSQANDAIIPEPPVIISTTTVAPSNVTTTTVAPANVTTTTVAPANVTTTAAPSTTHPTKVPTTRPSTTTDPTPSTTSTTAAPTKPTPKPKPEAATWTVDYPGTNTSCVVLKMALKMDIPYETLDNKTVNTTIVVPKTATASGSCEEADETQKLILSWKPAADSVEDSVTFSFQHNTTIKKFMLSKIEVNLTPDNVNFPNSKSNQTIKALHDKDEFITPMSMSYRCKPAEILKLTVDDTHIGIFTVSNMQFEAFHNTTEKAFNSAKDCDASQTPGIVPIAVGCSLAALIIVVLIAYLVGRRRTQARGYLSMFSEKQREAEYIPMKNISCFGK